MGKIVVLKFEGDLRTQGFHITLEIRSPLNPTEVEEWGKLPPDPALSNLLQDWQEKYRSISAPSRIKPKQIVYSSDIQQRHEECKQAAKILRESFLSWLESDSFRPIDKQLREELQRDEEVRLLLRSADHSLQKLPWHEWDFVQRFSNTEVVLTSLQQKRRRALSSTHLLPKNRILAILGHSEGINVETDRALLENLANSEVTFLVEPQRQQVSDRLWEQSWDVIFFAGHSETEGETGRIYLNPNDSLTIEELWYSLRKAVDRGLKLAIFNSCDGLGLVQSLDDLEIPHLIVMRELVPDRVAQEFLKYLLSALAEGKPVHLAVREARERLETLEPEFPCATWLPVIHQNVDYIPVSLPPQTSVAVSLKQVLLISLAATFLVMGIRWTGFLQSAELKAYDHVMQQRPLESIDRNIIVVEVTQEDINQVRKFPLEDDQLARLIQKIQQAQPRVVGLAMHRYQPRGEGRKNLIAEFQNPNLFTVCSFWSDAINHAPPPELSSQQKIEQIGFSDAYPDEESSVIRRQLLAYDPKRLGYSSLCNTPYSFSLQISRQFLEAKGRPLMLDEQRQEWQSNRITLNRIIKRTGGYQNLDGLSNQILINYRSVPKPAHKVSMSEILTAEQTDLLRDRIVLIGYDAPLQIDEDVHQTPIGRLSGVWLYAHVISQIISADLEGRSLIWLLPQWKDFQWGDSLFVSLWALLGGIIVWVVRLPWLLAGFIGISLFGLYQICLVLLIHGGWMPLIPAAISLLTASSAMAYLRYRSQKHC